MPEGFWLQVLGSALGELVAGMMLGLLFAVGFTWVLGLKDWAREQREDRRRTVDRTLRYIGLLRREIETISKAVPPYCEALGSSGRGTEIPIYTPVWDVVLGSGELGGLLDPEVLTQTAYFYGSLEHAKELMRWLILSWHVAQGAVPHLGEMQRDCRDSMVVTLGQAEAQAEKVLKLYDEAERRLNGVEAR